MLNSYLRDESGASSAEYALILAGVCLAVVGGVLAVQGAIVAGINSMNQGFTRAGF